MDCNSKNMISLRGEDRSKNRTQTDQNINLVKFEYFDSNSGLCNYSSYPFDKQDQISFQIKKSKNESMFKDCDSNELRKPLLQIDNNKDEKIIESKLKKCFIQSNYEKVTSPKIYKKCQNITSGDFVSDEQNIRSLNISQHNNPIAADTNLKSELIAPNNEINFNFINKSLEEIEHEKIIEIHTLIKNFIVCDRGFAVADGATLGLVTVEIGTDLALQHGGPLIIRTVVPGAEAAVSFTMCAVRLYNGQWWQAGGTALTGVCSLAAGPIGGLIGHGINYVILGSGAIVETVVLKSDIDNKFMKIIEPADAYAILELKSENVSEAFQIERAYNQKIALCNSVDKIKLQKTVKIKTDRIKEGFNAARILIYKHKNFPLPEVVTNIEMTNQNINRGFSCVRI